MQKQKQSLRQAKHSREADEGTHMSSEANREEFQTEMVGMILSALPAGVCVQIIQCTAYLLASRSVFAPN